MRIRSQVQKSKSPSRKLDESIPTSKISSGVKSRHANIFLQIIVNGYQCLISTVQKWITKRAKKKKKSGTNGIVSASQAMCWSWMRFQSLVFLSRPKTELHQVRRDAQSTKLASRPHAFTGIEFLLVF